VYKLGSQHYHCCFAALLQVIIRHCTLLKAQALAVWLRSNASHIRHTTNMHLEAPGGKKKGPCPAVAWSSMPWDGLLGLQQLYISGITSAAAASSAQIAAAPAVLQALTSLELTNTGLSFLGAAAATPVLRKLVCCVATGKKQKLGDTIFIGCARLVRTLPQLQQLTALKLTGGVCDGKVLATISSLTNLQCLELWRPATGGQGQGSFPSSSLTSLPASLTFLEVTVKHLTISPQALCQLTALQKLVLRDADLRTAYGEALGLQPFSELTRLEHLELSVAFSGGEWMFGDQQLWR
jgi:hypothetical protein